MKNTISIMIFVFHWTEQSEYDNGLYEDDNDRCIESMIEHCNKTVNYIYALYNDNYY